MERPNISGLRRRVRPEALILEDDESLAKTMAGLLEDEGYDAHVVGTVAAARAALQKSTPSVLILDLSLPEDFGADVLADLANRADAPPTVIVSVFGLAPQVAGRYDLELVRKPFEIEQLLEAVRRAQRDGRRPRAISA